MVVVSRDRVSCGVTERAVLAWILDYAPYQGSVDKLMTWLYNKAKVSYGKSEVPLQSVRSVTCYSLFREGATNTAGKEPHKGSGQPVKAVGHSFQNKSNL